MRLRYELRSELGSAASDAAFGVALGVEVSGSDGGADLPFGGGGGASQMMMGVVGVSAGVASGEDGAGTPSSWPEERRGWAPGVKRMVARSLAMWGSLLPAAYRLLR